MTYPIWEPPSGNVIIKLLDEGKEYVPTFFEHKHYEIVTDFENDIQDLLDIHGFECWHHYRKQKVGTPYKNVYVFHNEEEYQIAKLLI